jgi:hypothetical protein
MMSRLLMNRTLEARKVKPLPKHIEQIKRPVLNAPGGANRKIGELAVFAGGIQLCRI